MTEFRCQENETFPEMETFLIEHQGRVINEGDLR